MNLDLPKIVDALLEISEWPWHTVDPIWLVKGDDVQTYVISGHRDPHLGEQVCQGPIIDGIEGEDDADLYRKEQEAISQDWINMDFIASSPVWLAQLVVALVEAETEHVFDGPNYMHSLQTLDDCRVHILVNLKIDPAKFAELKKRLEEKGHDPPRTTDPAGDPGIRGYAEAVGEKGGPMASENARHKDG